MAGHSHSANIKYRKGRQDSARSQLFLKIRKKIESIIWEEGEVNEKSLSLARENKFPKEKVYQIWEKVKADKAASNSLSKALYQAPFGIWIYLENGNVTAETVRQLKLKKIPFTSLLSYFQPVYSLKLPAESNLEEHLFTILPPEIWEKIDYNEEKQELFSSKKEAMDIVKNVLKESKKIVIIEEKNFWQSLVPCQLIKKEEKDYFQKLEEQLKGSKFYTNVEK
jgi:transcriptional/translational regulatory protein YebC/TACO1